MKRPAATVLIHLVLLVGVAAALAPLAWMVAASLMPTQKFVGDSVIIACSSAMVSGIAR